MPPFLQSDMAGKSSTTKCIHYNPKVVSIWLNWNTEITTQQQTILVSCANFATDFTSVNSLFNTNIALLIGYSMEDYVFVNVRSSTNLLCKCLLPSRTWNAHAFNVTRGRRVVTYRNWVGNETRRGANRTSVGEIFLVSLALWTERTAKSRQIPNKL